MTRPLLFSLVGLLLLARSGLADEYRCPRCGSCRQKSVCCAKTEMRDKVTFEYQLHCEPVCMAAPSQKCGTKCVPDDKSLCGHHWETIWKPRCNGCVREQRTLMKVAVTKKEPVYSCEYRCICCNCGYKDGDELKPLNPPAEQTPPAEQPPTPEPAGADEKIVSAKPAHVFFLR
jgi:hypothetical protein